MVPATAVQPSTYGGMHVGDLYSDQEAIMTINALGYASNNSRASFVLSKLSRASITRWLHVYHFLTETFEYVKFL